MPEITSSRPVREEPAARSERERYDILILDGASKQALTSARSLGRAGLRVAVGESVGQFQFNQRPPTFRSRYCARTVELPDYIGDHAPYAEAIIEFVRDHGVRVVLPTADASIVELAPYREQFAALDCTLAMASDEALKIANDKSLTLEVATRLDIAYPKSVPVAGVDDLRAAEAQFGYPFVLKPTMSWSGEAADRVFPVDVINEAEATEATTRFLATGCGVLAQQWASGRREEVTLLMADGEVLGICGAAAYRTVPLLGGVSVMRETIVVPADILDASVSLVRAIGLDGPSDVEWRRDASGRPLLMEVNARPAGTFENANKSGVDFPLLIWQWATGQRVQPVLTYQAGVRTRWLLGELRWLWMNLRRPGRPDTVSAPRAMWTFLWEFARTRHYDYVDHDDMRPAVAEFLQITAIARNMLRRKKLAKYGQARGRHRGPGQPSG